MTVNQGRPYAAIWKRLSLRYSRYLDEKTGDIKHNDVISDLVGRTELSGSYLAFIIFANLIALLGLLTNSVAVVIGAMLISPLMGPIFSLGLAFAIGDLHLTRRAVRIIFFSVLLTVVVAALFTYISPLKGVTREILSRTRPNIYDLLIAVFAGTAGALALCTRKNYLFTTTGVAVATAVIPPLSVVGYGVGTWQFGMAVGGFLLFFTNLVAIVISSNIVFYILRFRGNMAEEPHYSARRRFQILGVVLVIISIPLIITLITDIREAQLTKRVESILKTYLNSRHQSRLTSVSIGKEKGSLMVMASINTLKYLDSETLKKIETDLTGKIGKPAKLDLEQVIVRSGAVDPTVTLRPVAPAASPPPEKLDALQEKTLRQLGEGCREVESFITPYKISVYSITYSNQKKPIAVQITINRDYPITPKELHWFKTVLERKMAETLELKVDTAPFLPPISFTDKDEIDEGSRKAMAPLRQIVSRWPDYMLTVEVPYRYDTHSRQRIARLKEYLVKELKIQVDHISVVSGREKLFLIKARN